MRRPQSVVVGPIDRPLYLFLFAQRLPGVEVPGEAGMIAARDGQTQSRTLGNNDRQRHHLDVEALGFVRGEQRFALTTMAKAAKSRVFILSSY
jgi:hypothetical protein